MGMQAVLFAVIAVWPADLGGQVASSRLAGVAWVIVGGAGIALSAAHLGKALTPVPEPNGAGLSARGLYQWMRHPMYTAVLVASVGVALARGSVVVWVAVVMLAGFFEVKSRYEERHLVAFYDGYSEYASRTGKFVPLVGMRAAE